MSAAVPDDLPEPPLARAAGGGESLGPHLQAWRERLEGAGTPCVGVALQGQAEQAKVPFPAELGSDISAVWTNLLARVNAEQGVALERCNVTIQGKGSVPHLVMAAHFGYGQAQTAVVGLCLPPPHGERTVRAVLLALASLQWSLTEHHHTALLRTARLLEVLGHVASQERAHAAAQEWVNRTAVWARECLAGTPGENAGLSLALFEVPYGRPRWWVGSDTAWAQKAAPAVLEAAEQASRAVASLDEVHAAGWCAIPALAQGRATAVLVVQHREGGLNDEVLRVLRSSLSLVEPLLRQWRLAERPLWRHGWDASVHAVRQLTRAERHGHLRWKLGGAAALFSAVVLLAIPFDERVSAPLSIEGKTRQLATAPFDGFVAEVFARPGERVQRGQQLLAMETRELKVERAKHLSDHEQASGKLRQAMAEHDAAAAALASAQAQQAQAQLDLIENKLARALVLAPLDGLVVSGDWAQQIGAPLEVGKQLFEIAAVDRYRVALHVADSDIARIRTGQAGELRLAGSPHRSYPFRVSLVTATASVHEGSNGFRVEADWQGPVPPLSPGMQGVGKVTVGRANLLTIWMRSSIDWLRMKWWTWWW